MCERREEEGSGEGGVWKLVGTVKQHTGSSLQAAAPRGHSKTLRSPFLARKQWHLDSKSP